MKKAERTISQVRRIFIATTVFLIALSFFIFAQIRNLVESSSLVNATNSVNLSLGKTLIYLLNAETNQRGYLLTADSSLLKQKDTDLGLMKVEIKKLDSLAVGNPRLAQKFSVLNKAVSNKLENMQQVLDSALYGRPLEAYREEIKAGVGKMNKVRMIIKLWVDSEKIELDKRTNEYARLAFVAPIFIVILFLGSLFILYISYSRVSNAFARSKELHRIVGETNERLEKQNEELEERNNFTEMLINSSVDNIFVVDRDTRFIAANKKARETYLPQDPDAIIGKTIHEIVPNAPLDNVYAAFKGEHVIVNRFESLVSSCILELSYIPLYRRNEVYAVMIITHDISDFIKIQDEIKTLNQSYEYAEQVGQFGSYRYHFDSGQLFYSANLYRILGCEPNEFTAGGEKFLEFVHPEDKAFVEQATAAAFDKKEISRWEYRMIRKDGQIIFVRGTGRLVEDAKQQLWMVGTLQDITEEKMQEISLNVKNAELERINAELESFAYISGHDLQEPLRKIRLFADQIRDTEKKNFSPESLDKFSRMQRSAERMQMLIIDLLSYSKTATAERKFEKADLSALTAEVIADLAEELDTANATVEIGSMCNARVIPFQFKQLLFNLLSNAIKFKKPNTAPVIKISAQQVNIISPAEENVKPGKYCHFKFSDNGIGFDQQYNRKIFEVFSRLHGKAEYKGTGIGLAIVKKIAENHNGYITATGTPGAGARFDIYLPA